MGALLRHLANSTEWRLDRGERWIIGRSAECAVTLIDDATARRHAAIEFREGGWHLSDWGSTNGTWLNGVSVRQTEVRQGDVIAIGRTLLWFETDGRAPAMGDAAAAAVSGADRREKITLPHAFPSLMTLFRAPALDVDGALIAARAGEALIRFAPDALKRDELLAAFKDGLGAQWPVLRAISAHGVAAVGAADSLRAAESAAVLALVDHDVSLVRDAALHAAAALDPLGAATRLHAHAVAALDPRVSRNTAADRAADLVRTGNEDLLRALCERAVAVAIDGSAGASRVNAAAVLGALSAAGDPLAFRTLRALVSRESDEGLRVCAIRAIGASRRTEALEALVPLVDDPSPAIVVAACSVLEGTRDERVVERLLAALAGVPVEDVQRRARYRRALEDVTGERRGPDPSAWIR